MDTMTAEEYQENLKTCGLAAMFLERVDVSDMLARIEKADSLGAVLDPTLYREKREAMMEDKELLEAAKPLWDYARKVRALRINQLQKNRQDET
jgi:hypothetical protein